MTNLLALCKPPEGAVTIKRVQITQPLQQTIGGLFQQQAIEFMEGVEEQIPFGGDWQPGTDEIMTLDAPVEIGLMQSAVNNPIALATVDANNFANENIKGLFVSTGEGANLRFLIQSFTAQQLLARTRLVLVFQGDTFRQVTEPTFTLDNKLVAIAEDGRLKFKSFTLLKRIFVLEEVYRVATDQQIEAFCAHASLHVPDLVAFKAAADQVIRRKVHAVSTSNILNRCAVADIEAIAAGLGLALRIENACIVIPSERQRIKDLLSFLEERIYPGPLSAQRLIASGTRPFGAV